MAALAMRFLSSATASASASFASSSSSSTPAPALQQSASKPSAAPAPRISDLPGVICKLCGTSVPMDKLGEHDCESQAGAGRGAPTQARIPSRRPSGSGAGSVGGGGFPSSSSTATNDVGLSKRPSFPHAGTGSSGPSRSVSGASTSQSSHGPSSRGPPPPLMQPVQQGNGNSRIRPSLDVDDRAHSAPERRPSAPSSFSSSSQHEHRSRPQQQPIAGPSSQQQSYSNRSPGLDTSDPGPGYSGARRPSHEQQRYLEQQPPRGPSRSQDRSPGPSSQQQQYQQYQPRPPSPQLRDRQGPPPPRTTPSPGPPSQQYRGPPPSAFRANGVPPVPPQRGPSPGIPPGPSPQRDSSPGMPLGQPHRGPSPSLTYPQQHPPPRPQQISPPSGTYPPPPDRMKSPFREHSSLSNSETPFSVAANPPPPLPHSRSTTPHSPSQGSVMSMYIPDTKVGGEAGMAGVGRRGFAAVAQAALFAQTGSPVSAGPWGGDMRTPSPGVWGPGLQRTLSPGAMGDGGPGMRRSPSPGMMGGGYPNGPGPVRGPSPAFPLGTGGMPPPPNQRYLDPHGSMGPGDMRGGAQQVPGPGGRPSLEGRSPSPLGPGGGFGERRPSGGAAGRPSLDAPSPMAPGGRRSPSPLTPLDAHRRPSADHGRTPSEDRDGGRRPSEDQSRSRRPSEEAGPSRGLDGIGMNRRPSEDRERRPSDQAFPPVIPPPPSTFARRPSQDVVAPSIPLPLTQAPSRGEMSKDQNAERPLPLDRGRKGSQDSAGTAAALSTSSSRPTLRVQPTRSNSSSTSPAGRARAASDASSTYTSLSPSDGPTDTGRQPVSNLILRNLQRKQSVDGGSDSESPTTATEKEVRLPFFEKLKAQVGLNGGKTGHVHGGSSSSNGSTSITSLAKKASQSSIGSSSSGSGSGSSGRRRVEPSGSKRPLPSLKERRESVEEEEEEGSDTELAYASFGGDNDAPLVPAKATKPLIPKGRGLGIAIAAANADKGSNSIPFPPSPSPEPPKRADSSTSSSSGRTASTTETSSSSYSASRGRMGPSSSLERHQGASAKRVGVKIVAASEMGDDDRLADTHAERRTPTVGGAATLGTRLLTTSGNRDDLDIPLSPASTPSPTTTSFSAGSQGGKKQLRQCRKCLKLIPRGKWVYVDVGTPEAGVMCDWDWKDSYLPKCRRCELPIEGHVISATDGQVTGKYHRACFSCIKCDQSFPDKEFYCHNGCPYCRYHYAEVTGSLCASVTCGQAIEGPCALDNDGKKYHPEHFLCDWAPSAASSPRLPLNRRGRCQERLEEYWEVGNGKYCSERHAMWAQEELFRQEEADRLRGSGTSMSSMASPNSKATKRRTLFVEHSIDKKAL